MGRPRSTRSRHRTPASRAGCARWPTRPHKSRPPTRTPPSKGSAGSRGRRGWHPRAPPGPMAVLARLRGGVATPRRRHRCTVSRAHGRQRGLDRPSVWSPVRRGLGTRRRRAAVALCPRRLTPRGSAIAGRHVWRAHRRATRRPRSLPTSRRSHEFSTPSRATSAQSSRNRYPHKATNDHHRHPPPPPPPPPGLSAHVVCGWSGSVVHHDKNRNVTVYGAGGRTEVKHSLRFLRPQLLPHFVP